MKAIACTLTFLSLLCGLTLAHMGITLPTPRDTSDDQKTSPCGNVNNQFGGTVTELTPGETYDVVLNSNLHNGIYRIALSRVDQDVYDCVLIDHVPQYRAGATTSTIPIIVPDVDCQSCALQAYMVIPSSTKCCDKSAGECNSVVWYACANVKINGKKPRESLKCKPPCTWAYRDEKPGVYSSTNNDGIWISTGNGNYRLNVSGGYYSPQCQTVSKSECLDPTTTAIEDETSAKGESSLADGGKMSAGGVIGIIIVILVLAGIGITWFIAVKNKNGSKPTVPMMANSEVQQQAVVQVEPTEEKNAGTYVRPPMPPPPPQRN